MPTLVGWVATKSVPGMGGQPVLQRALREAGDVQRTCVVAPKVACPPAIRCVAAPPRRVASFLPLYDRDVTSSITIDTIRCEQDSQDHRTGATLTAEHPFRRPSQGLH